MLATVKLKELIDGKEFGEISEVYANNLPRELEENTDKTIVLLTESRSWLIAENRAHVKGFASGFAALDALSVLCY